MGSEHKLGEWVRAHHKMVRQYDHDKSWWEPEPFEAPVEGLFIGSRCVHNGDYLPASRRADFFGGEDDYPARLVVTSTTKVGLLVRSASRNPVHVSLETLERICVSPALTPLGKDMADLDAYQIGRQSSRAQPLVSSSGKDHVDTGRRMCRLLEDFGYYISKVQR